MSDAERVTTLFPIAPNPAVFFPSRAHRSVLLDLSQAVANGVAMTLLTGEPGCGKSLLLLKLAQNLPADRIAVLVPFPNLSFAQLIAYVDTQVRLATNESDESHSRSSPEAHLRRWQQAGHGVVMIVDDADQMPRASLKGLLTLLGEGQSLQCVLASSNEIEGVAGTDDDPGFSGEHLHLGALSTDEIGEYLNYRMGLHEGAYLTQLEEDVLQLIGKLSDGIPQKLHRLCEYVMYKARAADRQLISVDFVRDVVAQLSGVDEIAPSGSWLTWDDGESLDDWIDADEETLLALEEEQLDLMPLAVSKPEARGQPGIGKGRDEEKPTPSNVALSAWLMGLVVLLTLGVTVVDRGYLDSIEVNLPVQSSASSDSTVVQGAEPPSASFVQALRSAVATNGNLSPPLLGRPEEDRSASRFGVPRADVGLSAQTDLPATESTIESSSTIAALLNKAQEQLQENRLTLPPNDNALASYNDVLQIEPENEAAIAGLQQLKVWFVAWGNSARQQQQYDVALNHYRKALVIDPDDEVLITARQAMETEIAASASQAKAGSTSSAATLDTAQVSATELHDSLRAADANGTAELSNAARDGSEGR